MDKADLEDRVKMLEQQLSAQIDTTNLIVRRNEVRIQELKVACADAIECNFTTSKYIIEHSEATPHREFIASEILIMSNRLRMVIKGKF